MFGSRILQLLLVALSIAAVAHSLGMDRMPNAHKRGIVMRQQTGGGDADVTADADPTDETTSPSPTQEPTDDPTDDPTSDPTPTETAQTSPKTTAKPTTTTKGDPTPDATSSDDKTPTPTVETKIETITRTNSDGEVSTFTSETTTTRTPGLSADSGSASSGMSTSTRNIVIGVVVGVGGAIVLGALGFVAWRIWGKKKHTDDSDNLMNYNTGYAVADKSEGGSSGGGGAPGRNPFQSTLETYHAPTPVNASSNF